MSKPIGYSYMITGTECPECHNNLTDSDALVVHTTHRKKSFRTEVGKNGSNFEGYIMDGLDATLIMRDPEPTFQCGGCFTTIEVEVIEEQ